MKIVFTFVAFLFCTYTNVATSNAVLDDLGSKGEACRAMAQTPEGQRIAHMCLRSCTRYSDTLAKYPELLTDEGVARCNKDYAKIQQGLSKTPSPINRSDNTPAVQPASATIPDVEGMWMGMLKGRMRVRADDRIDWQQICRDTVRIMAFTYHASDTKEEHAQRRLDQKTFLKQLKRKDRVRLIGITYNPAQAGKQLHCEAQRVEISSSN